MSMKIHIINMDKDRDRWNRCSELLQHKGFNFERFPGIDISRVDLRPYRTKGRTKGQLGCSISHRTLWKSMIANDMPWMIIAEDDVVPECDMEQMKHTIDQMPTDTDMLHFGCTNNLWGSCKRKRSFQDGFSYLTKFSGTHCYLITNKGARKYFARWGNDISIPIDIQLAKTKLVVYEPRKPLATHELMTGCSSTIAEGHGFMCVFDKVELVDKRSLGFVLMYPLLPYGFSVLHLLQCLCFLCLLALFVRYRFRIK